MEMAGLPRSLSITPHPSIAASDGEVTANRRAGARCIRRSSPSARPSKRRLDTAGSSTSPTSPNRIAHLPRSPTARGSRPTSRRNSTQRRGRGRRTPRRNATVGNPNSYTTSSFLLFRHGVLPFGSGILHHGHLHSSPHTPAAPFGLRAAPAATGCNFFPTSNLTQRVLSLSLSISRIAQFR